MTSFFLVVIGTSIPLFFTLLMARYFHSIFGSIVEYSELHTTGYRLSKDPEAMRKRKEECEKLITEISDKEGIPKPVLEIVEKGSLPIPKELNIFNKFLLLFFYSDIYPFKGMGGYYWMPTNTIYVYKDHLTLPTMRHEMAHAIYSYKIKKSSDFPVPFHNIKFYSILRGL